MLIIIGVSACRPPGALSSQGVLPDMRIAQDLCRACDTVCPEQEAERPVYSNTLLAPPACAALAALADSLEYLAEQLRQVGMLKGARLLVGMCVVGAV